ncbi:hypothetical protein DFH09DRAFT_1177143 [Mycena vulgaris]|nr:hypothetical protein DFH09DRAFT_1177143 [Mycena vulgaris]
MWIRITSPTRVMAFFGFLTTTTLVPLHFSARDDWMLHAEVLARRGLVQTRRPGIYHFCCGWRLHKIRLSTKPFTRFAAPLFPNHLSDTRSRGRRFKRIFYYASKRLVSERERQRQKQRRQGRQDTCQMKDTPRQEHFLLCLREDSLPERARARADRVNIPNLIASIG